MQYRFSLEQIYRHNILIWQKTKIYFKLYVYSYLGLQRVDDGAMAVVVIALTL
jgi:hypothetical protein